MSSQREQDTLLKMAHNDYTGMRKDVRVHHGMKEIVVLSITGIQGYPQFSSTDALHVRRIPPRKRNEKKRIGVSKVSYVGRVIDWDIVFAPEATYVCRTSDGSNVRFTERQREYSYFNSMLKEAGL